MIEISIDHPAADTIHASSEKGIGWKLDGFKEGHLAAPDCLEDDFSVILQILSEYVSPGSIWKNTESGEKISVWEAVVLLTADDN